MTQFRDDWRQVGGRRMYARVSTGSPANTPIVLVHGLGVSGTYMLPTAKQLVSQYPTYVPDLPGWGRSDKPNRALDVLELADALAEWTESTGLVSATFVANSLGCQIVVDLATRYPELIERAVLIGPTIDPAAPNLFLQAWRGLKDLAGEPLSLLPILIADYWKMGPLRVVRTLEYALKDPLAQKFSEVHVPTLVIRGLRDPIASQAWVERMAGQLPQGQLLVIPGASHAANFMAPLEVSEAVHCFINRPDPWDCLTRSCAIALQKSR